MFFGNLDVTQFDLIAIAILAVSGLIGFARGALRELITIIAFVLAVAVALFALRFTGPLARHWLHPAWVGNVAALLAGFLVSYIAIRIVGAGVARRVHDVGTLGGVDRAAGVGIGLIRGFVILGVFQMVFSAATPRERMPPWISHAVLYPATAESAKALKALEPSGLALAGKLAPTLKQAVTDGGQDDGDKAGQSARNDTVQGGRTGEQAR
jgi:membrane protein required for colicin V production